MNQPKTGNQPKNGNWWIKIFSGLALLYLIFSLLSPIFLSEEKLPRKIETPDIVLVVVILFFNSGLMEKLEEISFSGEGVEAKFQKLEEDVERKKQEIDAIQQEEIKKLERQQEEINLIQKDQKIALEMVVKSVIDNYELEKLEGLRKSQENQVPFPVKYREELKEELRHLLALEFIDRQPGHGFRTLQRIQGEANLAEHFHLTQEGIEYLKLREKLGIKKVIDPDE